MLQMKCPECDAIISSSFLVEMGSVTCDQCEKNVTVHDVFVTTRAFTMDRDTLLKRVRHYRALLVEVENELMSLENSDMSSTAAQKSLSHSYTSLRELLEASRENYRLPISQELPLEIEWAGITSHGSLLNLSTKGAAIKPKQMHTFPHKGSAVKLRLALPDNTEPLSIAAKIAWTGKREKGEGKSNFTMGVCFTGLNKITSTYLWDYISSSETNS